MLIATFTDPHVTRACEFSAPTSDGYNEYLQLVEKSFDFVGEQVLKHKPDLLTFNGDWHDGRDFVDTMSLAVSNRAWEKLSALPVVTKGAIPGNHDYYDVKNNIHTLGHLRSRGWNVYDTFTLSDYGGVNVLWLPFRDTYDLDELRALMAGRKIDVVCTHMDVVGGLRRSPRNAKDSKAYSENGVPPSFFAEVGVVLNGHYHHPSRVTDNFYNVGSLTTRTFHDQGSAPRGMALYNTETKELTRIPNPYARNFVELHVDTLEELQEALTVSRDEQYAKIYYSRELEEDVTAVQSFFAGSRLVPVTTKKAAVSETEAAESYDLTFSLEDNLSRYLETSYPGQLSMQQLGQAILKEAIAEVGANSSQTPLRFGMLQIRNYQSVGSIDIDLNNRGLIFVQGVNDDDPGQISNGAGKSGFIESVYWCLTGVSFRGLKGDEVINWNEDWCSVSLDVIRPDATYRVVRSRHDPEIVDGERRGTGVKLYKDGKDVSARLSTDTDRKVAELIGRSQDNLLHTVWITSTLQSSSFSKLSYPQRAQLLEEVLGSTPFRKAQEKAKMKLDSVGPRFMEAHTKVETHKKFLADATDRLSLLELDLRDHQKKAAGLLDVSGSVIQLEATLNDLESKIAPSTATLETLEASKQVIQEKVSSLHEVIRDTQTRLGELFSIDGAIKERRKRIETLLSNHQCPLCEAPVDRSKFIPMLDSASRESQETTSKVEALQKDLWSTQQRIATLQAALQKKTTESSDVRRELANISTWQRSTVSQLNQLKVESASYDAVNHKLQGDIDTLKLKRQTIESELQHYTAMLQNVDELRETLTELATVVFSERGVRNAILSKVAVPYLNSRLPEYTSQFLGGKEVVLTGDRPLKSGEVRNEIDITLTGKRTYKSCSIGEKRRIDLSIQFSIGDLAAACGYPVHLLVVDEVLDPLDESGMYSAKEVLRKRAERDTVLMISHSKYAAAIVPAKVVLRKSGNRTTILEQRVEDGLQY